MVLNPEELHYITIDYKKMFLSFERCSAIVFTNFEKQILSRMV